MPPPPAKKDDLLEVMFFLAEVLILRNDIYACFVFQLVTISTCPPFTKVMRVRLLLSTV
jgi:hypothetical protein